MISFVERTSKTRIPKADYILDKQDKLLAILPVLTPKFYGTWSIIVVEPTIKFVNEFIDNYEVKDFVDIIFYLSKNKMELVLLKHPKLIPKSQSKREQFELMISELKHMIDPKASKHIWQSCSGDMELCQDILNRLDTEETGDTITEQNAKNVCSVVKKPLYASEVYRAFMFKDWSRWRLLDRLIHELGSRYAYYALRKQSRVWLQEKAKYLNNESIKVRAVAQVDAPFINYSYLIFLNSNSHYELYSVMLDIDSRGGFPIERRLTGC